MEIHKKNLEILQQFGNLEKNWKFGKKLEILSKHWKFWIKLEIQEENKFGSIPTSKHLFLYIFQKVLNVHKKFQICCQNFQIS